MIQHYRALWIAFFSAMFTSFGFGMSAFFLFKIWWLGSFLWTVSAVSLPLAIIFMVLDNKKSHRKEEQKLANKTRLKLTRKRLGEFLDSGNQIYVVFGGGNIWAVSVEKYLEYNLGTEFVSRFRSEVALILENTEEVNPQQRFMEIRLSRLNEFLREYSDKEIDNVTS